MADQKKAEEAEENAEGKGSKKKLIFIIVGAFLLIGISVGATVMLLGGGSDSSEAIVEEAAEPERGDPSYVELKAFTVNLAPEDPVGFLQTQIQVLTYDDNVTADLEKHKPLIRNNLTLLFGRQKSTDLRSPEGKQALQQKVQETIQSVINKYGSGGEVENIFFTNFVMQ